MTKHTKDFLNLIFRVQTCQGIGRHLARCPSCNNSVYIVVTGYGPLDVKAKCMNPRCTEEYRWEENENGRP